MKLVVLNDGETYTTITGCAIVEIDDKVFDFLEESEGIEKVLKERLHTPFDRVRPAVAQQVKILRRLSERSY